MKQFAVSGTINGFAFQNSLMPNGDGTHSMMVNKIAGWRQGGRSRAKKTIAMLIAKQHLG